MLERGVAISVKSVKKNFLLPHEKVSSVKSLFTSIAKRRINKIEIQHALRGIDFDIKKGEFFGIVGRNGSGKSTLLKIIAGIYQPTKGSITTNGRLVPFIELGVGFNPELTGRENVFLNGAILGYKKKEIEGNYKKIVKFAELEKFMDQKLKNYSSGMQVRLAFACATMAQADILLVDEVLAVGDADFQRKCYDYFKSLKKTNTTVIFVTHDMGAVREYCDRAILIEDGVIKDQDTAEIIADKYLQLFNGSDNLNNNNDKKHWGTGDIKIQNIILQATKDEINFAIELEAKKDFKKFVVGYNFKNAEGTAIMGGNSINAVEIIGDMSIIEGQKKLIKFNVPNFLGSGIYSFEVAIKSDRGIILDKKPNAGRIKVAKLESYYPTHGPAKIVVINI